MSTSPASDDPIYRQRYLTAITVTLAAMMELLDTSIVNVAISQIMGNLGATLEEVAWVSTGYIVANVIVLPLSGWLSNFFGRRRYFMGSIILFIVASFFCGNAGSLEALVFWRIVQGIGGGGLLATAQSTIYEVFPSRELGSGMAIFGMGVMMGPTLGPTVGGYITYHFSWPWIFFINLPIGLLALMLANRYVPESRFRALLGKPDWWGIAILAVGIAALQIMLEEGERQQWFDSAEIIAYAVVAIAALGVLVWHELRIKNPVLDLRILANRQFAASLVFSFLLGTALFTTVFYLPLYLQTLRHYNAWETGMVILPGALANGFTMAMLGKVNERLDLDRRWLVVIGVTIFGLSMWQHGQFTTESGDADFFWPLILRGVGLGFLFVPLNGLAMATMAPAKVANATGLYTLVRHLGGSVGIAVAATLFGHLQASYKMDLSLNVSPFQTATTEHVHKLEQLLTQKGSALTELHQRALHLIDGQLTAQASMIAFEHLFMLFSVVLICALPLLLVMTKTRNLHTQDVGH